MNKYLESGSRIQIATTAQSIEVEAESRIVQHGGAGRKCCRIDSVEDATVAVTDQRAETEIASQKGMLVGIGEGTKRWCANRIQRGRTRRRCHDESEEQKNKRHQYRHQLSCAFEETKTSDTSCSKWHLKREKIQDIKNWTCCLSTCNCKTDLVASRTRTKHIENKFLKEKIRRHALSLSDRECGKK